MKEFLTWAKSNGWQVEFADSEKQLPDEVQKRYANVPGEYLSFYEQIGLCSNAADTSWFLTEKDFLETDENTFAWNTFEKMSMEAAMDDAELIGQIEEYWHNHLPVMLCVGGDYEYYALDVVSGAVVNGYEPEFEECSKVADSFSDFLSKIMNGAITV